MIDNAEYQLMVNASVLYYLEGKTQSQIAKQLFLSRPKVSRLLKKARDLQIVDITINYQSESMNNLKEETRQKFNIPNLVVTKTISNPKENIKEVCKVAAKEIGMMLSDNMTIGISWGRHIGLTSKFLKKHAYSNIKLVELFGVASYEIEQMDMNSIGRTMADKLDGTLYSLPTPIYVTDGNARQAIMENPVIKRSLDIIDRCDLIITGIGAIDSQSLSLIWDSYVDTDIKQQIVRNDGIGFILAHYYNLEGDFLNIDINNSIIGIKTEDIKRKKLFAIASGMEKSKAIYGALKGNMLHTLVIDEKTLEKVLLYTKR